MLRYAVIVLAAYGLLLASALPAAAAAAGKKEPQKPKLKLKPAGIEQVAKAAAKSVVVITVSGRDGKQHGLGTGFVVSADGLIATNLHVIGEARPISVQFADGRKFDVASVHASDRALDLALVRIKAKDLTPLKLGDARQLTQGERVVVLGNPYGLKHSVVSGVVSGIREVEGRKMIQLAIPIEPGNSGGPVLSAQRRVLGVVTMKSLVNKNLGFAVQVDHLKPLLAKPNPIPMARWLTIGALDAKEWTPLFGARWQQRAGRILVSGPGQGFGGRALCLAAGEAPKLPYEIAVTVRLGNESGAAGLAFYSDGDQKHYGFYPSAGKLRLSRFDGPTVFTWKVLREVRSEDYRPGDWNHLKVHLEEGKIRCYVNDKLVIESADRVFTSGKLGLAKFRDTQAQFKHFRVARKLPPSQPSGEAVARIGALIDKLPPLNAVQADQLAPLAEDLSTSLSVLRRRAKQLQQQAAQLRKLAGDVHTASVTAELGKLLAGKEKDIDLGRAALLIALLDDDELDVAGYLKEIDRMAADISQKLPQNAPQQKRREALGRYLFAENGFHGSRTDYYHRANSYLNRVIDDREGLPITLSVLYMELGRRLGISLLGVGLPGHFVVRHAAGEGDAAEEGPLIDVFDGGKLLSRQDAEKKVKSISGQTLQDEHLKPYTKKQIIQRMLHNLIGVSADDKEALLRYTQALIAVDATDVQSRGMRAVLRFETGRRDAAIADLDWFLQNKPQGIDLEMIRKMRAYFQSGQR